MTHCVDIEKNRSPRIDGLDSRLDTGRSERHNAADDKSRHKAQKPFLRKQNHTGEQQER